MTRNLNQGYSTSNPLTYGQSLAHEFVRILKKGLMVWSEILKDLGNDSDERVCILRIRTHNHVRVFGRIMSFGSIGPTCTNSTTLSGCNEVDQKGNYGLAQYQ